MAKNSIRQQVFKYINTHPYKTLKEVKKEFSDSPTNTIREYYRQSKDMSNNMSKLDIRTELIKIIKDKKEPGSTKVSALRFLKDIIEITPEKGDDPLLKLLLTLEKENSDSQK